MRIRKHSIRQLQRCYPSLRTAYAPYSNRPCRPRSLRLRLTSDLTARVGWLIVIGEQSFLIGETAGIDS